jgi:hypothetical protein
MGRPKDLNNPILRESVSKLLIRFIYPWLFRYFALISEGKIKKNGINHADIFFFFAMEAEFSVLAEFFGGAGRKNLERQGNTESLSPVLVSLSPGKIHRQHSSSSFRTQ